jgi:germination protein M
VRLVVLALVMVSLTGCADGDEDTAPPTLGTDETTATATTPAATTSPTVSPIPDETLVRVYFLRNGRLAAVTRSTPRTRAVATAAMRELLSGPEDVEDPYRLATAIPGETTLRSVSIEDGVAVVELSQDVTGAAAAQVVHTLTQFPNVSAVELGGARVRRADYEQFAPQILVDSPTPGAEVSSPLRVTGSANTFEATFFLKVVDSSGKTLVDRFFTATSGSGTRGTFDATLQFAIERPGPATLIAYERSAENGEPIHVVRIPIRLEQAR